MSRSLFFLSSTTYDEEILEGVALGWTGPTIICLSDISPVVLPRVCPVPKSTKGLPTSAKGWVPSLKALLGCLTLALLTSVLPLPNPNPWLFSETSVVGCWPEIQAIGLSEVWDWASLGVAGSF